MKHLMLAYALAVPLMAGAPVFTGAKGFGIDTPAGRGGRVIRVTTLQPEGPGSLREALEAKGPRIVVFEIAGVIDLSGKPLRISEPFVTVAGQTAPSPGITIIRGGMGISTHDVLMQHIRIRMGDNGRPKKSGYEPEVTTSGPQAYNIVVDHCSMSWAVDENLSASGPRYNGPSGTTHRVTFSNNILAEGLYNATHSKGIHSMGTLVHDSATDIAIIGNLYAHNNQRNPYFKAFTTGVIVNNVIYNPGLYAIQLYWQPDEWVGRNVTPENARVSIVGNVVIHGANTKPGLAAVSRKGDAYLEDNIALDRDGRPAPITAGEIRILKDKPSWPVGLVAIPAKSVADSVIAHAGARPRDRDAVDQRIIREFQERKGHFIDSQEEVGGYPKVTPVERKLQVPEKNMEAWLEQMARTLE